MGAHDFNFYKVHLLPLKPVNINVSMFAAPKLALVLASCYNCHVMQSSLNVCAKFH